MAFNFPTWTWHLTLCSRYQRAWREWPWPKLDTKDSNSRGPRLLTFPWLQSVPFSNVIKKPCVGVQPQGSSSLSRGREGDIKSQLLKPGLRQSLHEAGTGAESLSLQTAQLPGPWKPSSPASVFPTHLLFSLPHNPLHLLLVMSTQAVFPQQRESLIKGHGEPSMQDLKLSQELVSHR